MATVGPHGAERRPGWPPVVAGVDVGAPTKGFHVAILDGRSSAPQHVTEARRVTAVLATAAPALIAVDSPIAAAPPGERSREAERQVAKSICHCFYTPDCAGIDGHPTGYYAWVQNGFRLYALLRARGFRAIECFPTATCTRLYGPRAGRSRARWTTAALAELGLGGLAGNQDERDALLAALTARCQLEGRTEWLGGQLVVPLARHAE